MSTRRAVLTLAPAALLAGCSWLKSLTGNQVVIDIGKIAAGLSGLVQAVQGFVPSDVLTKVQAALATIESLAAQIQAGTAPTASIILAIADALSQLASLLGPLFPQASPVILGIQAAISLIKVVLQATGVVPQGPMLLRATPNAMTADQARALLDRYAVTGLR